MRLERNTGKLVASVVPTWRPYAGRLGTGALCGLKERSSALRTKPHAKWPTHKSGRTDGRFAYSTLHAAMRSIWPAPPSLGAEVISSRASTRRGKRMTTAAGAAPESGATSFGGAGDADDADKTDNDGRAQDNCSDHGTSFPVCRPRWWSCPSRIEVRAR